jgi:hypothetical protein
MKKVSFGIIPDINFAEIINSIDIVTKTRSKIYVAIGGDNGKLMIYDLNKQRIIKMQKIGNRIIKIKWSVDGNTVICGLYNGEMIIWNI